MRRSLLLTVVVAIGAVGPVPSVFAESGVLAGERDRSAGDRQLFSQLDTNGDGLLKATEVAEDHRRLFDRLLRRADADRNGALSPEEFVTGLTPSTGDKPIEEATNGEFRGADQTRLLLLKLDTNGDSRLTRGEAPEELREAFDQLVQQADRDKDGQLNRFELSRVGPQLSRRAGQVVRRMGWDVSKELSRLEAEQGAAAQRFERQYNAREALKDPKQAADLFKQFDANRDNQLELSEIPQQIQQQAEPLLRRADTNRDGVVTKKEFLKAAERITALMKLQERFRPAEVPSMMQQEEGSMSGSVAEPDKTEPSSEVADRLLSRWVKRADRNGDGVVTRGEARGRAARQFAQADQDKNGRLDPAELEAMGQKLAARLRESSEE